MLSTRKIIRVFLASPGDLQDERKVIREVVDEFNESWANALGYQVELVGWEETIAGFGRPQHLINQDLDRCDLFVGMIWKRWGTPPDKGGVFSSGFEEEFRRSMASHEQSGSPEISLYFKQIPDEFREDPGEDLKKVLEFRERVIADKKILFQNFATPKEMESLARKCITAYVNRIRTEDESSEPDELHAKRARLGSDEKEEGDKGRRSSPLLGEDFRFLEGFVEKIGQPDSLDALTATDVARFRLLANSISKPGNEEMDLGVHDINLLFAAREGIELSKREILVLTRLGFRHLGNENVPLWYWYSALRNSKLSPAVISSVFGADDNEKVGAISVLTALALVLPTADDFVKRHEIIESWFSDDSSPRVRTAALGYLAKCGRFDDFKVAKKEYDRSDRGTSRNALECMVGILLRNGRMTSAQELVLESQFESLDPRLLSSVLAGFGDLETPSLRLGLEHRDQRIRLRAMKALLARGALDVAMTERLTNDSDALVRGEAVKVLLELGRSLDEDAIKRILVQPQKQFGRWGLPLNSMVGSDKTGEELFEQHRVGVLKSLSESELEKKVEVDLVYDDTAYFALVEQYYASHSDELRRDVDDRFSAYFEKRIKRMEATFGDGSSSQDLVKKTRDLEEFLRKKLTRRGLDVLCAADEPEDLQRIRANLRSGYAGASKLDARYLGRHGEWSDIPILANAERPGFVATLLTSSHDDEFQLEAAKAITSIGKKHSATDLLSLDMPAAILEKTIARCAKSRFARISDDALFALFEHKLEGVRKAAAVLAVCAFPAKRIRSVLREYVDSDKSRYYNVTHWLDWVHPCVETTP